jgi:HK97 gp10 family phage protein
MANLAVGVSGLAELDALLKKLPAVVEFNVMRGALRAGQKVIMDEAKALVPVDQGDLRDSIRISYRARSKKFGWTRMHLIAGNKKAYNAHWIEYGTASFYTGRGRTVGKPYIIKAKDSQGKELKNKQKRAALRIGSKLVGQVIHPGIKPQPFMRPAFDRASGQAITAAVTYIRTRLHKELLKNAKR